MWRMARTIAVGVLKVIYAPLFYVDLFAIDDRNRWENAVYGTLNRWDDWRRE